MAKLTCRLRSWFRDPFGHKKEKEENRKIINQIVATRVLVRTLTTSSRYELDNKFPIAHMVMHEREGKRKD